MTNDRVSTLEHVYDEWARGNFRAGQDLFSDEVEYQIDYPHGPQTYVGREGVATYMREILREWAHMQVEAEEIVEIGDHVFVAQRQVQTGQLSGVRVEEHTAAVWTFSGDHVVPPAAVPRPGRGSRRGRTRRLTQQRTERPPPDLLCHLHISVSPVQVPASEPPTATGHGCATVSAWDSVRWTAIAAAATSALE